MVAQEFRNLADYEAHLRAVIAAWPPARRTMLTAAMAERWLPIYQSFSSSEKWGDPDVLRRGLDAVWGHVEDQRARADWAKLKRQLHEVTPHMDDFDANEALCACIMVHYAVERCTQRDNLEPALMGVLSGLEAVLPDVLEDENIPARLWRQAGVCREINKQLRLVEQVQALSQGKGAYQALLPIIRDPEMAGGLAPRPPAPAGPTNEQAYQQYRQIVEQDIKGSARDLDPRSYPEFATTLYFAAWMGRYSRRRQILSGEYGALADQTAVRLLLKKNQARDLAEPGLPDWDASARELIDMCYQNSHLGLDARTPESPHGCGPSLRRLWVEAKRSGLAVAEAWESIRAWAKHQPAAWGKKGKQGGPSGAPGLQVHLKQPLSWSETGDPDIPWETQSGGAAWRVRLNDFPDEIMYTLLIDGAEAGDFHDWPANWKRQTG